MKLMPWRKSRELVPFKQEFDDLWSRMLGSFDGRTNHLPELFHSLTAPPINVSETETAFTVTAELPGLDEEDIRVEVMGRQLLIAAERKWNDESDKEFHRVESQYGTLQRSVPLPDGLRLDSDAIDATYDKGMLTVSIPKVEPTPTRRIDVKAS